MAEWWVRGKPFAGRGHAPKLMAVLNVTPDSFSDGGSFVAIEAAVDHALRLEDQGADLIDIGGESSRPGATPVPLDEERRRVLPVLEALEGRLSVPISIDTMKPELARAAIERGASILNDIGGLRDPAMLELAVSTGTSVVIMHMAGTPQTMQLDPVYDDVVEAVLGYLAAQVSTAEAAGLARTKIALDPGIGFGKTAAHNVAILRDLERFDTLGCSILVGLSRKRFIGAVTGRPIDDRLIGSVVASLASVYHGAAVVRVHEPGPMLDSIRIWDTLVGWSERS